MKKADFSSCFNENGLCVTKPNFMSADFHNIKAKNKKKPKFETVANKGQNASRPWGG